VIFIVLTDKERNERDEEARRKGEGGGVAWRGAAACVRGKLWLKTGWAGPGQGKYALNHY
jgi:hypothetical protein